MLTSISVYEQTVSITTDYLGPAAKRFIDRQVANHLHKKPEAMTVEDIPILINWAKIAMALLTDDHHIIDEFIRRMNKIHTPSR
jgi:hypothetical protein